MGICGTFDNAGNPVGRLAIRFQTSRVCMSRCLCEDTEPQIAPDGVPVVCERIPEFLFLHDTNFVKNVWTGEYDFVMHTEESSRLDKNNKYVNVSHATFT